MKARKSRIACAIASAVALAGITMAVPADAATGTVTVKEAVRVCAKAKPGRASCDAMKIVYKRVAKNSVEAKSAAAEAMFAANIAGGPAGGYSPAQIAKAYNLDVNASASTNQTVAIVDAYNDPNVLGDLNHFDANYGLPAETNGTTFKVVNQTGGNTLPANNSGWAEEISLDVQTVRGLCHACKIILVETTDNSFANLAAGVNEAATLHATVISNSYGGDESATTGNNTVVSAYDHPGIPIVASSGGDGYHDFDFLNANSMPSGETNVPASYRTVVGVGGTSLYLNPDSSRAGETAWNDNGPGDAYGFNLGGPLGAAGSGCSAIYAAKGWQSNVAGYSALGCGAGLRSEVDVAAVADPFTGFDLYDSYNEPGWMTIGGTSLAAPVIASMFALSGGGHGIAYPALTLYGHLKSDTSSHLNDIKIGGTGECGTLQPTACLAFNTGNPNTAGFGDIDCAFADSGSTILASHTQCYAAPGFDGVSGVGTPNGVFAFSKLSPKAVISGSSTAAHGHAETWSSSSSTDPFPGATISTHTWSWGDGTANSSGTNASHTYAHAGTFTITLTIKDSYGVTSASVTKHITVS